MQKDVHLPLQINIFSKTDVNPDKAKLIFCKKSIKTI